CDESACPDADSNCSTNSRPTRPMISSHREVLPATLTSRNEPFESISLRCATVNDTVSNVADELFESDAPHGVSLAMLVMHRGDVVFERYGIQPDSVFGPGGPISAESTLISWSMAKSITHAAVGLLIAERRLELDEPAAVPQWRGTDKAAITLQNLLDMRPGSSGSRTTSTTRSAT